MTERDQWRSEGDLAGDTIVTNDRTAGASAAGVQVRGGGSAPGTLSVLVLDDEPIVGKRLRPALEKAGLDVECFVDPAAAIARIEERAFDIVVTDVRMEGVDGIEILERIMAREQRTRVILITGYATVEVAREALVKGAFDFIAKPFKPGDLMAVINKAALSLGHKAIL